VKYFTRKLAREDKKLDNDLAVLDLEVLDLEVLWVIQLPLICH
jgi:hypothetical protein